MRTLRELRADKRISSITKVSSEEFSDGIKYEINLNEGYSFGGWGSLEYATSVKDLNDLVAGIVED